MSTLEAITEFGEVSDAGGTKAEESLRAAQVARGAWLRVVQGEPRSTARFAVCSRAAASPDADDEGKHGARTLLPVRGLVATVR